MGTEDVAIRRALREDESDLGALAHAGWDVRHEVSEPGELTDPFFRAADDVDNVLVATVGGTIVGFVKVRPATPLPSNAHVQQIQGLLVSEAYRGRGIGRSLLEAAIRLARERGARKVSLRVLGSNPSAEHLYAGLGFEREGVLVGEFLRDGSYVDDVLMALVLT